MEPEGIDRDRARKASTQSTRPILGRTPIVPSRARQVSRHGDCPATSATANVPGHGLRTSRRKIAATEAGISHRDRPGKGRLPGLNMRHRHSHHGRPEGRRPSTSRMGRPEKVAAPPATPRHPNHSLPLLPSGPGGVYELSSRGDRRGHHKTLASRDREPTGRDC